MDHENNTIFLLSSSMIMKMKEEECLAVELASLELQSSYLLWYLLLIFCGGLQTLSRPLFLTASLDDINGMQSLSDDPVRHTLKC